MTEYVALERVEDFMLFFQFFFLFDQSGYRKHAGGFLWLFNASLYGYVRNRTEIQNVIQCKRFIFTFWNLNTKFRKSDLKKLFELHKNAAISNLLGHTFLSDAFDLNY